MVLEVLGALAVTVCCAAGEYGRPDLIETRTVARSSEADYYAFPSIARLAGGDLVCVFYLGVGHVSPDGRIALARSTDEGKTWSKPEIVVDTPDDDRDPSIMQTRAGRVLLNFFVRDSKTDDPARRLPTRVFVAASDDGGRTFAKPAPIDVGWDWEATSDEILELADGTLLLPFYGQRRGDTTQRAAVAFSRDGGNTWSAAPPADIAFDDTGKGVDFQEPALVLLPDRTIVCSLRTTNAKYHAYESRSTDRGRTWSPPADTGLVGHAAALLYHSSGVVFQAYRSWTEDGKLRGVAGVFARPHEPWDPAREFDILRVGGDVAYPSAVELSDGSIFCVYYVREHRAIEAAVIPPESIKVLSGSAGSQ